MATTRKWMLAMLLARATAISLAPADASQGGVRPGPRDGDDPQRKSAPR